MLIPAGRLSATPTWEAVMRGLDATLAVPAPQVLGGDPGAAAQLSLQALRRLVGEERP